MDEIDRYTITEGCGKILLLDTKTGQAWILKGEAKPVWVPVSVGGPDKEKS